jgi:hypothetical protein
VRLLNLLKIAFFFSLLPTFRFWGVTIVRLVNLLKIVFFFSFRSSFRFWGLPVE